MSRVATLFANTDQTRYFDIPEGTEVAPGSLVIRSLLGEKREVDLDAVVAYEVPEAEAKALVRTALVGFVDQVKTALGAVAAARPDPALAARAETSGNVLAGTLGLTPEEFKTDPTKVVDGLKGFLQGLQQRIEQAGSLQASLGDDKLAHAMNALPAETSAEAGKEMADKLGAELNRVLSDPKLVDSLNQTAENLKAAADEMKRARLGRGELRKAVRSDPVMAMEALARQALSGREEPEA